MTVTATASLDLNKHFTAGNPVHDWLLAFQPGDTVKFKDGQSGRFVSYEEHHGKIGVNVQMGSGNSAYSIWHDLDYVFIPSDVRRRSFRPMAVVTRRW